MTPLELTLAILKPHIIKHPPALSSIRNLILTSNFKIVRSKRRALTKDDAEHFYSEHKQKFFYNRLVTFMTSGQSDLYILAKDNAIKEWRKLMGPTKVYKAQFEEPNSIRGTFGLSDTRNATHGSDSVESACREMGIFFPEFDINDWYKIEEEKFRSNSLRFCASDFVHKIDK